MFLICRKPIARSQFAIYFKLLYSNDISSFLHLNYLTWRYIFNLLETKVKEPIPNRYLSTLIGTLTHYTLCIPNSHNPKNFKSSLMGELELDTVYKDFKWWSKIYKTWYLLHIVAWDLGQIGLTTVYQQIRFDRKSL